MYIQANRLFGERCVCVCVCVHSEASLNAFGAAVLRTTIICLAPQSLLGQTSYVEQASQSKISTGLLSRG